MTEVSAIFGYIDLELWKTIHHGSRWIICRCIRISAAVKALFIDYIAIAGCFKKPPGRLKGSHIFWLTKLWLRWIPPRRNARRCGTKHWSYHKVQMVCHVCLPLVLHSSGILAWQRVMFRPANGDKLRRELFRLHRCANHLLHAATLYVYLVAWVLPECKPIDPPLSQPLPSLPFSCNRGNSAWSFTPFLFAVQLDVYFVRSPLRKLQLRRAALRSFPAKHAASGASPNGNNGSRAPQFP